MSIRRISLYFIPLLFILVFSPYLNAEEPPLQKSELPLLQKDSSQTFKILQALFFESKQQNKKAYNLWQSLEVHDSLVQDHLFINRLSAWPLAGPGEIQGISPLLLARYYTWNGDFEKTIHQLNKNANSKTDRMEKELELARALLYNREYNKAGNLLASLRPEDQKNKLQREVLRCWLFVLTEQSTELKKAIQILNENHLYLSPSLYVPLNGSTFDDLSIQLVRQAFLWFPSDKMLSEAILLLGDPLRNNHYQPTLDLQWMTEELSPQNRVFIAGLYLGEMKFEQSKNYLKNQSYKKDARYFEVRSQLAIKTKNWKELRIIANQYQRSFPDLADPKLYLAEYYKQTGQKNLKQKLLKSLPDFR